ncbi:glucose-1-phosphate adenylyltransferase [Magnetospira sp. QH-2]|uniref:glucose-1-phosphate adenylyltransferase n=1 Tax=Magnetospira sp. (strain QH-2) TaxID=1288970 RepID=UPI0003E80AF4|nr:glucose-1-phosphate adenylyltransferase [Magnetospira sp. QH-2]CCQ73250.1 Glucose-1-phosphate adenylyltransferase [Magnetospira sp. QH-2]
MQLKVLAIVLAGGKGTRLFPLTKDRAKPAVPFGGKYRIVDFVLSNLINSGIHSIYVLIQFRSQSLLQHLTDGWSLGGALGHQFVIPVPAQMRSAGESWYRGTADAIAQNLNLLEQAQPDVVVVFGADHIYRMNIREMINFHAAKGAVATIAALPTEKKWAGEFGVIEAEEDGKVVAFHEKDPNAPTIPGRPDHIYASMGNYVFSADALMKALREDTENPDSSHDFGHDVLPKLLKDDGVYAYDFSRNTIPGEPEGKENYWRDVGTLDAYYEAQMDLRSIDPALNLYNQEWPLRTAGYADPPAKLVFNDEGRRGQAIDSILSGGCILSGGLIQNSVLSRYVRVHSGAEVHDSVILDNCEIGRGAKVRNAILAKNVRVAPGDTIGYDLEADAKKHHVTPSGLVVVDGGRSSIPVGKVTVSGIYK